MTAHTPLRDVRATGHEHVRSVLPHLRRHAYMLAGNRQRADDAVSACLQAYTEAPDCVRPHHARIDMFRLFHAVLRAPAARPTGHPMHLAVDNARSEAPQGALSRLDVLSAPQRRILMLVAVEGFSLTEAARILDMDLNRAASLLTAARRDLLRGGPVPIDCPDPQARHA